MDIRLKTALHYVWLAEQPGWGPYARAEVARMDSEMELFRDCENFATGFGQKTHPWN